ncbi:MAG: cardiolipin synthase [Ruminococcus sp.]|nr:cardiolipin synthase [Ruminococcus sp.]
MSKKIKDEEGMIRLIPIRRKGIFRLVFSRLAIIIGLLALQVGIIVMMYHRFEEILPYSKMIFGVFTIVMLLWLCNTDMVYIAKFTWAIIFFLFPVPGALLFFLTMSDIGHRALAKRTFQLIGETRDKLPHDPGIMGERELMISGMDDLCKYVNRTGCFPIFRAEELDYFPSGEAKFTAVLEELRKAEKFIFMEYFIIAEGYMWSEVLKILRDKAAQGVEIRVMYDGMCEMSTLTHDYPQRLEKLGIRCHAFSPITPFLSTYYNYRDHRKILVVDGKVAFNGGINFADEYINRKERFGHWKDTAVMIRGSAVSSFTLMFLQMWNISEKEPEWDRWLTTTPGTPGKGFVMPFADSPLDDDKVGENVIMDILNRATTYVHIMTPYLILDGELENALKFAAERGIDVKIILPGIPDKKTAYALAKTHYKSLLKAGVKIYEYTPGFVHGKVIVSDDKKAVVGSINLDFRSLYHHFECATYMYKTSCIGEIGADFHDTLKLCRQVTSETIKHERLYYKVVGRLMKFISPLF